FGLGCLRLLPIVAVVMVLQAGRGGAQTLLIRCPGGVEEAPRRPECVCSLWFFWPFWSFWSFWKALLREEPEEPQEPQEPQEPGVRRLIPREGARGVPGECRTSGRSCRVSGTCRRVAVSARCHSTSR